MKKKEWKFNLRKKCDSSKTKGFYMNSIMAIKVRFYRTWVNGNCK